MNKEVSLDWCLQFIKCLANDGLPNKTLKYTEDFLAKTFNVDLDLSKLYEDKAIRFAPSSGDVVWIDDCSQKEELKKRAVLVLSDREHNIKEGVMIVAPLIPESIGQADEMEIEPNDIIRGFILCDSLEHIRWREVSTEWSFHSLDDDVKYWI